MNGRAFSFLGSGEFEPWSADVDRRLLSMAQGDGRVLIVPTASAREGDEVFDAWGSKGLTHFAGLGVPAEVVPLRTRDDAHDDGVVDRLNGASVIYFSGGNPWHLAEAIRDTPFLDRMLSRLDAGMAFAGCSAGVACLTGSTFDSDSDDFKAVFKPGLGLIENALFGPHWDMIDTWIPGATAFIVASVPPGAALVGLDEQTAMLGDGRRWEVIGAASIHVLLDGAWSTHGAGEAFELTLAR